MHPHAKFILIFKGVTWCSGKLFHVLTV